VLKKLMLLASILALALTVAIPALAQEVIACSLT
jgi:hypothetical protein